MITLPLRMRYGETPLRTAAAWLIPGAEPQIWLEEMLAWEVSLEDAALYLVPRTAADLTPQAVLVVLPDGLQPRTTHRSQAFAALRSSQILFLPVEARFEPEASDAEIAALAAGSDDCVWHPAAGLIALEATDRRSVADLLARPEQLSARWDLAEPGQHFNARLTAIVPAMVPSLDVMIDQGRGDIGSDAGNSEDIPGYEGEPSGDLLSRLGRAVQRKLAKMLESLTAGKEKPPDCVRGNNKHDKTNPQKQSGGFAGATRAASKLLSTLASWAREKIRQADEAMQKNRHRELERLMRLLKDDPDQGLRYALPFWSEKNRGVPPPGDKLPQRNVNFDLRRMGKDGGDFWNLPEDYRNQLRAKYMELAGREMRLGRYRRAAYIYAHLLGDIVSAAGALVEGKHWREAAAIYRERLNRPDEAARLLEQGGLWAEAIALYEEQQKFEKVGDLYAKLEQPDEAANAWRQAVEQLLSQRDHLAAARLLETKLQSPDEALDVLAAAWPDAPLASGCLAAQFTLLGRLGRHGAAEKRVEEILAGGWPPGMRSLAIDRLVDNAAGYPHDAVRARAADSVRTMVAAHLREAAGSDLTHHLEAIRRLVPADRLLERDTNRYLRQRMQAPPAAKAGRPSHILQRPAQMELKRLTDFGLPGGIEWQTAVACDGHFYAAGFKDRTLCLAQATWNGRSRMHTRNVPQAAPIVLSCDARGEQGILQLVSEERVRPIETIAFVASDSVLQSCSVGSPPWVPHEAIGVSHHPGGTIHVLVAKDNRLEIHRRTSSGAPLGTTLLAYGEILSGQNLLEGLESPAPPLRICARVGGVYVGVGQLLLRFTGEKDHQTFNLWGLIRSLCGSAPYAVGRVVATLAQGAVLLWEDDFTTVRLAEEMHEPVACFTSSGWIVLASARKVEVYRTDGRKVVLAAAAEQSHNGPPIAALSTSHPDGFGIVRANGLVEVYQMPRR